MKLTTENRQIPALPVTACRLGASASNIGQTRTASRGELATRLCARLGALVLLLLSFSLHAAQSDFSKPIDVKADRSEYNEKNGTQILSGNVEIKQGSMLIRADEIDVALKDNKLSVIKGSGSPIRFQQENEQGELVTGSCNNIIYDAKNGVLTLLGNASLSQPKQQLKSEKIVFNSINQTVVAEGGQSGQVSIQIQPPDQN